MTEQPHMPGGPAAPADQATDTSAGAVPRGGIADAIFVEVQQMTANGAMSKNDAFEAISARSGRRAGTVAANYYSVARKRGAILQPRTRRSGTPTAVPDARTGGGAQLAVSRLEEAVGDLSRLVREQEAELADLRVQVTQFDRLKALIATAG